MRIKILVPVVANMQPQEEGAEIEVEARDGLYLIGRNKAVEIEPEPIKKKRGRPSKKQIED